MKELSFFDVIGPNMIGPSSSHTAGAAAIARFARRMFDHPVDKATFVLYGSFAKTYRGHGTDRALLGGVLGMETDDAGIRDAFSIAQKQGLAYAFVADEETLPPHPNTVDLTLENGDGDRLSVRGVSTGGGKFKILRINGMNVEFTGEYSTLIIRQLDTPGVVAHITRCLSEEKVNIAFMRLFRERKGENAFTIVESDQWIPENIRRRIAENQNVRDVMLISM